MLGILRCLCELCLICVMGYGFSYTYINEYIIHCIHQNHELKWVFVDKQHNYASNKSNPFRRIHSVLWCNVVSKCFAFGFSLILMNFRSSIKSHQIMKIHDRQLYITFVCLFFGRKYICHGQT